MTRVVGWVVAWEGQTVLKLVAWMVDIMAEKKVGAWAGGMGGIKAASKVEGTAVWCPAVGRVKCL